jgi:ABC-type phosphate transport system substrate-binding protein
MAAMTRTRWGTAVAALLLPAALALLPARAAAAFTTPRCGGADAIGRGDPLAGVLNTAWRLNFQGFFCSDAGAFPNVSYEAQGSDAGRAALAARNQPPRFAVSDRAPTAEQVAAVDAGTAAAGDEGRIRVVPAAATAVVPLVNFPNNCDVSLLPAAERTAPQDADADRVRFTKAKLEAAWAKDPSADTWPELFPELAADPDCNKPIERVVAFDDSGVSLAFRQYLDQANPSRGWLSQADTRVWPNATVGARTDCAGATGPGSQDDAVDQLTSSCSPGIGGLINTLTQKDGSIGYATLARARDLGLAIAPGPGDDDKYWTQLQNGSGGFVEPTVDPNGFRTTGQHGAACASAAFTALPSDTLGDWSGVREASGSPGWPACALEYGLVFDDAADAYGGSAAEEAKARSVKDYWSSIVADSGQGVLFANDYAPLPAPLLGLARAGVEAVDFDKAPPSDLPSGGGSPGGGRSSGGSSPGGGGGARTGTRPKSHPSNLFSVPRTVLALGDGSATFSVRVPGPGAIAIVARARRMTAGRVRRSARKAGLYRATLRPARRAKRILRAKGRLRVRVTVTYRPRGGKARSSSRPMTLKLKKRSKPRA